MRNLLFFMSFLLLTACASKGEAAYDSEEEVLAMMSVSEDEIPSPKQAVVERKIIKTGYINYEVDDVNLAKQNASTTIKKLGGYISSDRMNDNEFKIEYIIEIRVPSALFDSVFSGISDDIVKVDSKDVNSQDVTEEYIDVQTRIRTKKQLESRYLQLLAKAKTVEEMLKIEEQLGNLRTEIESAEGRMKYLNDQISMSTITLIFYQNKPSAFGFTGKVGQALSAGWDMFLGMLVGLMSIWPVLIIIGALAFAYRQYRKKHMDLKWYLLKRKKKSKIKEQRSQNN